MELIINILKSALYVICCAFIITLICVMLYFGIKLILIEPVVRYYIGGMIIIALTVLSLAYISMYDKK